MKRGIKRLSLGLLLIIGAFVLVVSSFSSLHQGKSLQEQFPASGSFKVSASDGGRYYLWDNYVTQFEGQRFRHSSKIPKDIQFTVTDSDGSKIDFISDTSRSWSIGNHAKKSIGYLDSQSPGEWTIHVSGGDGTRVLSFSKADMKGELIRKLGGFGVALVFGLAGFVSGAWGLFGLLRGK